MNDPIPDKPPDKHRRLGRGLGALIGGPMVAPSDADTPEPSERLREIPLHLISPNPSQPRREFHDADLKELEDSLRANGLLQPITVRPRPGGQAFELVAGERRVRAARRLGWSTIPAIVRTIADEQLLTLALVENLQREDLNPIEEAEGYRRLSSEFSLTQQQVADAVGKERSTIANVLRLLNLPAEVQRLVTMGELSPGHARALLSLPSSASILEVAQRIVRDQLTVRDVERLGKEEKPARASTRAVPAERTVSPEVRFIVDQLRRRLQTDVQIVENGAGRGEVRLRFYSVDDLERLVELIAGRAEAAPS